MTIPPTNSVWLVRAWRYASQADPPHTVQETTNYLAALPTETRTVTRLYYLTVGALRYHSPFIYPLTIEDAAVQQIAGILNIAGTTVAWYMEGGLVEWSEDSAYTPPLYIQLGSMTGRSWQLHSLAEEIKRQLSPSPATPAKA